MKPRRKLAQRAETMLSMLTGQVRAAQGFEAQTRAERAM